MARTTEKLAADRLVKPETIHKRFSKFGSYYGLRPVKLPNGRLLWPEDDAALLTRSALTASSTAAA